VFGIVRRKSRSELVRQELGQGVEHFKQAATHAARGTGATVGPKISAARDRVQPATQRVKGAASSGWGSTVAVLAPLAAAATDSARQAGKQGRKVKDKNNKKLRKKSDTLQKRTNKALGRQQTKPNASKLAGLLLAGAAVGAGAAYVLRRRQRQQWDEYDPSRPIGATDQAGNETALKPDGAAFEPGSQPKSFSDRGMGLGDEQLDQSSAAHQSPSVARMAGGSTDS
jgi:hypothetical protein